MSIEDRGSFRPLALRAIAALAVVSIRCHAVSSSSQGSQPLPFGAAAPSITACPSALASPIGQVAWIFMARSCEILIDGFRTVAERLEGRKRGSFSQAPPLTLSRLSSVRRAGGGSQGLPVISAL